jgi:hypothetical protein
MTTIADVLGILPNILGGIVSSIVFAILLYLWQKPWLRLSSEAVKINEKDDRHFYHIKVENKGHTIAYNCKVDIIFSGKNLNSPISIPFGKWGLNPEPAVPMLICNPNGVNEIIKIPHDSLLKSTWYITIPPHGSANFALLLKYRDDVHCYGFNGENYILGFRDKTDLRVPSRRLDEGEYVAQIIVTGDNTKHSGEYYIINHGTRFSDLKIIPY